MKNILALSILLCGIAGFPALCETPQSALEIDIAVMKTEIQNMKENIKNGFDNVQKDFDGVQKDLDNIQKNFDRQNNIIIACIGIPLATLAIGATVRGILAHRRSRRDLTLEQQIETLAQEIETLKQRQIVSP